LEVNEHQIKVESVYGRVSKKPLVNMTLPHGLNRLSMSPAEARDLAANLLEAAEAAMSDGFIYEFTLGDESEGHEKQRLAAGLMFEFRKFRAKHEFGDTHVDGEAR
jgi:hypothetical protein